MGISGSMGEDLEVMLSGVSLLGPGSGEEGWSSQCVGSGEGDQRVQYLRKSPGQEDSDVVA